MRPNLDFSGFWPALKKGVTGAHMLAFLPALCLSAFWIGGEAFLVFFSIAIPLAYAAFGGVGRHFDAGSSEGLAAPSLLGVAQEFLEIAQHNGQTTACFQFVVPELDQISKRFGEERAADARALMVSRLRSSLRAADHVFHDDETGFTVLIAPGFRLRLDDLLGLGKRLRSAVETPLAIEGVSHACVACIGIASSLNFGRNVTAETWLLSATEAVEEARVSGLGTTRLWSDRLSRHHKSRHTLQDEISAALDQGMIQAVFQPQVNLRTGDVIGMETFARWDHPTRGVLTATEFLSAARNSQQMSRLGRTIFLQAMTALLDWDASGFDIKTISVNLSEDELRDPDLAARIKGDLVRVGLPSTRMILEICDRVLAAERDAVVERNLRELHTHGCAFVLDRFGAEDCGIVAIQQVPLMRVKLDSDLVRNVDLSDEKRRAVYALLGLCERLDIPAVATGVETLQEQGVLRDLGCTYAQGNVFATPASASEIGHWLAGRQPKNQSATRGVIHRIK